MSTNQIKVTKTLKEIANESSIQEKELLIELLVKVRKATIAEYGRNVSAKTYYDTSKSEDGRVGFHTAIVNYPAMPPNEIEFIAELKF